MMRRILTTALIAGFCAGIFVSLIQQVRIIPLIEHAEILEMAALRGSVEPHGQVGHHGEVSEPTDEEEWVQRQAWTLLFNILTGVGFGLILAAIFAIRGASVDWRRGLFWGAGGFAAFSLAPALGLPPSLPGTQELPLIDRQVWWLFCAAATIGGLGAIVFGRGLLVRLIGVLLLIAPHAVGAPGLGLAALATLSDDALSFVLASLITTGMFWLVLGSVSGMVFRRSE